MFEAKFPGECSAGCGEPIVPGQLIISDPADNREYLHEHCSSGLGQVLTLSDEVRASGLKAEQSTYAKPTKFQGASLEEMGF